MVEYLQTTTTTTLDSISAPLDDVYFPSITVCNMNRIKYVGIHYTVASAGFLSGGLKANPSILNHF